MSLSAEDKQACYVAGTLLAEKCVNGCENSEQLFDKALTALESLNPVTALRFKRELIFFRIFVTYFEMDSKLDKERFLVFLAGFKQWLFENWDRQLFDAVHGKLKEYGAEFILVEGHYAKLKVTDSMADSLLINSGFEFEDLFYFDSSGLRRVFQLDCRAHKCVMDRYIELMLMDESQRMSKLKELENDIFSVISLSTEDARACYAVGEVLAEQCVNGCSRINSDSINKKYSDKIITVLNYDSGEYFSCEEYFNKVISRLRPEVGRRFKNELVYFWIFFTFVDVRTNLDEERCDFVLSGMLRRLDEIWGKKFTDKLQDKLNEYNDKFCVKEGDIQKFAVEDTMIDKLLMNSGLSVVEFYSVDLQKLRRVFVSDCRVHKKNLERFAWLVRTSSEERADELKNIRSVKLYEYF